MISMQKNRIKLQGQQGDEINDQTQDTVEQAKEMGNKIVAQIKTLAVDKPAVVVIAGLAIGVLTGFMLKRR